MYIYIYKNVFGIGTPKKIKTELQTQVKKDLVL